MSFSHPLKNRTLYDYFDRVIFSCMIVKRPLLVYLLVFGFFLSAIFSVLGTIGIIQSWGWLKLFSPEYNPIYAILKTTFFFLASVSAGIFLWVRLKWSGMFSAITALFMTLWFWLDKLAFVRNPETLIRNLLPFAVSFFLLATVLMSVYFVEPWLNAVAPLKKETGDSTEKKEYPEND